MKKEQLYEVLRDINEDYIEEARRTVRKSRPALFKWAAVAACLGVTVTVAAIAMPAMFNNENTTPTELATIPGETAYSERYVYHIDNGYFSAYIGGKVIAEERIGGKIEDVILTAGWKNPQGEWISQESLRGEVYLIDGVSKDIAVALKFLDKGEAVTLTHFYVILNPEADLTVMEEYTIPPDVPNHFGDETGGEVPE